MRAEVPPTYSLGSGLKGARSNVGFTGVPACQHHPSHLLAKFCQFVCRMCLCTWLQFAVGLAEARGNDMNFAGTSTPTRDGKSAVLDESKNFTLSHTWC